MKEAIRSYKLGFDITRAELLKRILAGNNDDELASAYRVKRATVWNWKKALGLSRPKLINKAVRDAIIYGKGTALVKP